MSILLVVGDMADTINYLLFIDYLIGKQVSPRKEAGELISRNLLCSAGNA